MTDGTADYHESARRFADALQFTASQTGFSASLIEKDYFCTLILRELRPLFEEGLVFKGGTSLAKVHAGYYRLSEDLDFGFSIKSDATRRARRIAATPIKEHLNSLPAALGCIKVSEIRGENESRQYRGACSYQSCITGQAETIKVEVSFREPVVESSLLCSAKTILINPLLEKPAVGLIEVRVLSLIETYAEKARAALSRREPAIRDFYDLDFAMQRGIIDLMDHDLLRLLRAKLAIAGNQPIDISDGRLLILRNQINAQLRPVLRPSDFAAFDIDRPIEALRSVAEMLYSGA